MSRIHSTVVQLVNAYQTSQLNDFEARYDKLSIHRMSDEEVLDLNDSLHAILSSIQPQRSYRVLTNLRDHISAIRKQQIKQEKKRVSAAKKSFEKTNEKRTAQLTKLVIVYCGIFVILYQLLKSPFDSNQKEIHNDVQYGGIWGVFAIFSILFGLYYRKIAGYNVQLYTKSVNMPMEPIISFTYCKLKQCSELDEVHQTQFSQKFREMNLSFYQINKVQLLINLLDKMQPNEKRLLELLLPILEDKKQKLKQDLQETIELANVRFQKVIHFSEENVKLFILLAAIAYQILKFYRQSRSSKGNLLDRTVRDTVTGIILTVLASIIIGLYWFFNIYVKIWRAIP